MQNTNKHTHAEDNEELKSLSIGVFGGGFFLSLPGIAHWIFQEHKECARH